MAYDGRIMRQALARFEEDKQRREADFNQRRRRLYDAEPRLHEIEQHNVRPQRLDLCESFQSVR